MTNKTTLMKALLGATALTVASMGTAHAAGTAADTTVSNTFTLDYTVGTTAQPTITNDGVGGNDDPTDFTVDRLVDVDVATTGDVTVDPGETGQLLVFTVTNNGNDTQAYDLSVLNEADDEIADGDNTNDATYVFAAEPDGSCDVANVVAGNLFTGPITGDVAADETICVVLENDIDVGAADGTTDEYSLIADTVEPSTSPDAGDPLVADSDGNDIEGDAENVLADDLGTASSGDDGAAGDGAHSASAAYDVLAATLSGTKDVVVVSQDGSGCGTAPATPTAEDTTQYAIPGACVEYVITVENTGSASATDVVVADTLNANLTFQDVSDNNFAAGAFDAGTPTAVTDCAGGACVITFENGEVAAGETATVIIRALLK